MSTIKIHCHYDELVSPKSLKDHPKNRNKHDKDQIERLAKLYEYHGIRHPIIVSSRSKCIVAGHGRKAAAVKAGLKEMPVVYQSFDSDEAEYAFIQADNAIALWAELDLSGINDDLGELGPDFDIDLLGIKNFTVDVADKDFEADEDEVPEARPEPKVVRGEVYILGNHRLMCGDSTAITDVDRLMAGENADITFTSPPYNAAKNGHLTGEVEGFDNKYKTHNDAMDDQEYLDLLNGFTGIAATKSKYCFVNLQMLTHNRWAIMQYQTNWSAILKDILIWNKKQCPPNIVKGAFNTKWEYIFCFSEDNKTRGFPCDWRGQFPNVVETESNASNEFADDHKAGFPVSFPSWFLEKFDFARSVYEPFCGTGTTIIASEKFGRKCFGMELDPIYCGVILDRWQKFTGKKAHREDGIAWDEIKGSE